MNSRDNDFELIELKERAREFLLLDVNESQKNLMNLINDNKIILK